MKRTSLFRSSFLLALMLALTSALPAQTLAQEQKHGADMMNQASSQHSPAADLSALEQTDPDLAAMRARLTGEEAFAGSTLDAEKRHLITLAVSAAIQNTDEIESLTENALLAGASAVAIKETLYQCAPYIGFPRTEAALRLVNAVFLSRGIALPVESQATVTDENRFEKGLAVQKSIFGNAIDQMHAATPEGQKRIMVEHLSAFCFGDIYTRRGLDLKTRELVTFSIISALGGCESQVKSHVQGNANVGNSKQEMVDALTLILPLIGFPRTLNALGCVNAVLPE